MHIPTCDTVLTILLKAAKVPYVAALVQITSLIFAEQCSACDAYIAGNSVIQNVAENKPNALIRAHCHTTPWGNLPTYDLGDLTINGSVIELDPEATRSGSFDIRTRAMGTDYGWLVEFIHTHIRPESASGYAKFGCTRPTYDDEIQEE